LSLQGVTVGVVFGARSVEHEISIITACQAMPVLRELGAVVVPLYITKDGRWLTKPEFAELDTFRQRLPEEGAAIQLDLDQGRLLAGGYSRLGRPRDLGVDVIYPCLHGTLGEDGTLAALADVARLPQVGSPTLASSLAMDKFRSKKFLEACGLPVVAGRATSTLEGALEAASGFGYPLVVKPNRSGSSIGVSLVEGEDELQGAMEMALTFDTQVVLEPAVRGATDLNCAVKRAHPRASEVERPLRASGFLSYRDKYATKSGVAGGQLTATSKGAGKATYPDPRRELPAQIPAATRAEVQRIAVAAFDALGCAGSARVDLLLSDSGELFLNEVNTIPGSLAFYLWEASQISFPALLEELVNEALTSTEARQLVLADNLLAANQLLGKASS
jgi:D-alanine-D-alanine ligase